MHGTVEGARAVREEPHLRRKRGQLCASGAIECSDQRGIMAPVTYSRVYAHRRIPGKVRAACRGWRARMRLIRASDSDISVPRMYGSPTRSLARHRARTSRTSAERESPTTCLQARWAECWVKVSDLPVACAELGEVQAGDGEIGRFVDLLGDIQGCIQGVYIHATRSHPARTGVAREALNPHRVFAPFNSGFWRPSSRPRPR